MKLFKKESVGFKRKITLFGFINIAYNSKSGSCLKIKDLGLNNNVKYLNPFYGLAFGSGGGCLVLKGNNNNIEISPTARFNNSRVEIIGDNLTLKIGENCIFNNLYAVFSGSKNPEIKNKVTIGDNFCNTEDLQLFAGGEENNDLEIGNDCLFSRKIAVYTHDGHSIYDLGTNQRLNLPKNSVKIGDRVWIGHGTTILKNTIIPNDSIVGSGSVVTGQFTQQNTVIAGNPARVVKENVYWKR